MKKLLISILLLGLLLAGVFCDKLPGDPPSGPEGIYRYAAQDSTGGLIVKGWFTLVRSDSIYFDGEWHFKKVAESYDVGPQIGDGTLVGKFDGEQLNINLNPGMMDNNVLLSGTVADGSYAGTWTWVTIIGPTTGGTFTALLKK